MANLTLCKQASLSGRNTAIESRQSRPLAQKLAAFSAPFVLAPTGFTSGFASTATCHALKKSDSFAQTGRAQRPARIPSVFLNRKRCRARTMRVSTMRLLDSTELGCASLVAGTMVGAGVLALPAVSAPAGFVPSTGALILTWGYMVGAALISAEVAEYASCALGRPGGVSLLSQARLTLGPTGAAVASAAYVFKHVAILVAYVSQGAEIAEKVLPISHGIAGAGFLGVLSYALYAFNDEQVDIMNNVLFGGVLVSFIAVLSALVPTAHFESLVMHQNWTAVPRAVPTLLLSCVFHNIVGSVASRLRSVERTRKVILIGSGVPLLMFIAVNAVVLAVTGSGSDAAMRGTGFNPLTDLSAQGGFSAMAIDAFSLLAVATSAIGFVEGLNQLWNDARVSLLQQDPKDVFDKPAASYALTVIPPVLISAYFPGSFLAAVDIAGLYGVSFLFGFLPAAMAWRQRYSSDVSLATAASTSFPGGRLSLGIMMTLPVILVVYNTMLILQS